MGDTWTANRVPDQTGRVAVVTGGNSGVGFATAKVLAARGACVVLACRSHQRATAAADDIADAVAGARPRVVRCDLASLASVREAAADLRAHHERVDLLIDNAGGMPFSRQQTEDGFELAFGANHLGHFALTGLLLDRLVGTPGSRIVVLSSTGHRGARLDFADLQSERSYSPARAYGRSKLANLLFTYELQRRLAVAGARTISLAVHPGAARSRFGRNAPLRLRLVVAAFYAAIGQSADVSALGVLRAATDPSAGGGEYYSPTRLREFRGFPELVRSSEASYEEADQRRLWEVSEELTGVRYPI